MAKNSYPFPMAKTGGGLLAKVVGVLVVLAVVALVVKHPTDSASWLTGVLSMLGSVVDGLAAFLRAMLG